MKFIPNAYYKRKAPVTMPGSDIPLLAGNFWCFRVSQDGKLLRNTQVEKFAIPADADSPDNYDYLFDRDEVVHLSWTDAITKLPRNAYWIEGEDVAITSREALDRSIWALRGVVTIAQSRIVNAYTRLAYERREIERIESQWKKVCDELSDQCPDGLTFEEWATFQDCDIEEEFTDDDF